MNEDAPGRPGIPPRWTSSAKTGVGTSAGAAGRLWFTVSHGIVNEIYYPRIDQACTRDLGFVITDDDGFFSEEKRQTVGETRWIAPGVPGFELTNTCRDGRYRIRKTVLADPERDVLLQEVAFEELVGGMEDYHLVALLAPHIGNRGADNRAWVGDYKGTPLLFAEARGTALAMACSAPWRARSVGYVGFSDGWQDLRRNGRLTWAYPKAEEGNVALAGEVDLGGGGRFVLAVGFGRTAAEAGQRVVASLGQGFEAARRRYVEEWRAWHASLDPLPDDELLGATRAVMRVHESIAFPGGMIASLSIPWGFAKGDDDMGGYHLVWPRDLVESAGGLMAVGATADACRVLEYLRSTQEADGHWPQNMWLDGSPYWSGVQMDETALPILAVDLAVRLGSPLDPADYWPMVRRAAGFLARNGPVTGQDRWEEDAGYSPFTLATEVAALLVAADMAGDNGDAALAGYLRETADTWNEGIDRWTFAAGTDLAEEVGVDGYYVRLAPPDEGEAPSPLGGWVAIKNRPPGATTAPATEIVSPDALALVRFGLRAADDPRVIDTVKVIDHLLAVETPSGPAWRRYNEDGYGEHEDGAPFDGTGVGRAWPLLTGERAHYELAAGRIDRAQELAAALRRFANEGHLLPEQVWDGPPLPERELLPGRPSGSAMPLVWAHAEYAKLARSLAEGRVFDLPPQTVERYVRRRTVPRFAAWRWNHRIRTMPAGRDLRIEVLAPATIHWSTDGWATSCDVDTGETGVDVHVADLATAGMAPGGTIVFTLRWADRWEGTDYRVTLEES